MKPTRYPDSTSGWIKFMAALLISVTVGVILSAVLDAPLLVMGAIVFVAAAVGVLLGHRAAGTIALLMVIVFCASAMTPPNVEAHRVTALEQQAAMEAVGSSHMNRSD